MATLSVSKKCFELVSSHVCHEVTATFTWKIKISSKKKSYISDKKERGYYNGRLNLNMCNSLRSSAKNTYDTPYPSWAPGPNPPLQYCTSTGQSNSQILFGVCEVDNWKPFLQACEDNWMQIIHGFRSFDDISGKIDLPVYTYYKFERITLSINIAGRSMPNSRDAHNNDNKWRSHPLPIVDSNRESVCTLIAFFK